ncbi:MAG: primase-helicase family protein, partial [Candidatus Kariarchaeaceae archaeon]
MYEHVERSRVEQLIAKNDFDDVIKKQLKNYLKKYDRSQKGFRVDYETQGLMIGRKFAKGSLSLQNFKKTIRESLVYDTHTDIDIVNCHVVLLAQYCEKQGLICKCLDDYVSNRNVRLQEIIDTFKTTRRVAKELILITMYGGIVNEYCCQNGFDINVPMPQWVIDFEQEIKVLTERICAIETTIFADVKKLKKKQYQNRKSSCLSYTLQVIEDNIIMNACTKLKRLGYCVDTLCFDGMLVHQTNMNRDVLEELSSYCFETTGYKVEFEFKPMEKHYDFEPEKYDFTNYEFDYLDEYNQKYCASLDGETPEETYQKRKAYIEYFLCKVQQPEPLFIFQNGVHKTPHILNPSQLSNLLKPIQSGYISQMGGVIPFADKWTNDVNHRLYRAMDFIPYNENNPIHDNNMFNLFEGFNPDIYGESMPDDVIEKKITPYLDLVNELTGEGADYFNRFIAQIFQNPSKKVPICIVMKGKQGVGKNIVLDAIGNMLNPIHYITSSKPTDFFGEHAEGYHRKLLVNLNEAEGKDTFDFEGKMKSFISEDTITINPKNVRPTQISNHARTIVTTNKPNPIPIDVRSKDRRYVVFQASEAYLNKSSKFWSQLYRHLRKAEVMSALYQWFMKFDLEGYDWIKRRPITKAYIDMCSLYSPVEALFFEEFYDRKQWIEELELKKKADEEIIVPMQELFMMYERFCKKHRFIKEDSKLTSSRSFISRLNDLDMPVLKYKAHGTNSIKFIPKD